MKKFILLLLLIFSTNLYAKINLDENIWYIHKGFNKKWTNSQNFDFMDGWKKEKGKTVKIKDIYSEIDNNIHEYSIITKFNAKRKILDLNNAIALHIPAIGEVWQVFINGKLIKDEYKIKKDGTISQNRAIRGAIVDFSPQILKPENNILLFRISGNPNFWRTGLYHYPGFEIDKLTTLYDKHSELTVFMLLTFYLIVGLFYFMFYFSKSKKNYIIYLAIFTIGLFIYFFTRSNYIFHYINQSDIILRIEYISLFIIFPTFIAFFDTIYFKFLSKPTKYIFIISLIFIFLTSIIPFYYTRKLLYIWQFFAVPTSFYFVFINIKAINKKIKKAKFLFPGTLLVFFTALFDIFDSIFFHTGISLSKYGIFLFVFGLVILLFLQFSKIFNKVEKQIKVRTSELVKSLETIKKLKLQQDGDYYLTSLIIEPLIKNDSQNKNVLVENFIKQKKHFYFKNKSVEIGGDINISTDLKINDKEYLIFMNSDAMGKSLQGVSGAIVIGVSFNLFINRTKKHGYYSKVTPEEWIKESTRDLQRVFSGFNGAMLASLVVCLLEIETGELYYLNAEHPKPILYRNKKASYFEGDQNMYKIGIGYENQNYDVSKIKLKYGDYVILGSDGKDDINIGNESNMVLHNNDNFILETIEETDGDIYKTLDKLSKKGDFIDDISLLSVKYIPSKS